MVRNPKYVKLEKILNKDKDKWLKIDPDLIGGDWDMFVGKFYFTAEDETKLFVKCPKEVFELELKLRKIKMLVSVNGRIYFEEGPAFVMPGGKVAYMDESTWESLAT